MEYLRCNGLPQNGPRAELIGTYCKTQEYKRDVGNFHRFDQALIPSKAMIKTASSRMHRYGQANQVIFVLAQPERQTHMHPSILLPHHIIIPIPSL